MQSVIGHKAVQFSGHCLMMYLGEPTDPFHMGIHLLPSLNSTLLTEFMASALYPNLPSA